MDTERAEQLLAKYKNDTLTPEEQRILDAWYLRLTETEKIMVSPEHIQAQKDKLWNRISNALPAQPTTFKPQWYKWTTVAASLILIGGITFYTLKNTADTARQESAAVAKSNILPGSNKAVLTLASGETISLTDASNGQIAQEAGTAITKTADGQISYSQTSTTTPPAYNSISTPRGGQYALTLADGTKVLLNAASSLRYPSTFSGTNRTVELIGEAYFEVAKDKAHPFIVTTKKQDVTVLGTHFNINAYPDELHTKTTLLEGSVQITKEKNKQQVLLKPGQQSTLNDQLLKVEAIDTDEAIAWKNGYFQFTGKTLEDAMSEVARWYDIEVEYENNRLRKQQLAGTISKYNNVTNILEVMELTGALHFRIAGRKIIVK